MGVDLRVLGSADLLDGSGKPLRSVVVQPKRFGLLVFLALSRPAGFHRRDELLALFWPDQSEERARSALNQALSFLRRPLGSDVLPSRGADEVGVDLSLLSCDALACLDAADRGDEEGVLARYVGELLPAFHVEEAPAFGDWLDQERRFLRDRAAAAAKVLSTRAEAHADFTRAIDWALRGTVLAPCDETLARQLVLLYDRSGNPGRAVQAYDEYSARLRRELDVEPSAELCALVGQIRSRSGDGGPTDRPTSLRIIRDTVPDGVDSAAVFKALSKVPADRFETAGAFIRALDSPSATNASTPPRPRVSKRTRAALGVAGAVAVVAIGARLAHGKIAGGGRAVTTLTGLQQITFTGNVAIPAISGDGKTLAYGTRTCGPSGCLYGIELRDVTGGPPHRLLDGANSIYTIDWSPDQSNLLVRANMGAGAGSYIVSVFPGGTPTRVKHATDAAFFADGDSLLLLFQEPARLYDEPRWLLIAQLNGVVHDSIRVGDPGDRIAFALQIPRSNRIVIGRRRKVSTSLAGPLEAFVIRRDGRVLSRSVIGLRGARDNEAHASSDALWISPGGESWPKRALPRIPIDPASGLFASTIDTIDTGVHTRFGVTTDGSSLVLDEGSSEYSLWALDVAHAVRGEFPQKPLLRSTSELNVRMSPDGKRILVGRDVGRPADGRLGWSTIPFDGPPDAATSLALGERTTEAFWSDNATVAIRAPTDSVARLALVDVGSGVVREPLNSDHQYPRDFAHLPTGGWIWVRGVLPELGLQRLSEPAPRRIRVPTWYGEVRSAAVSPDGRFVAFSGYNAGGQDSVGVSVMSLADQSVTHWFTIAAHGGEVGWLSDGTLLLRLKTPGTFSLYHLTQPDRATKLGTIPRAVSAISVSADLKRAAIVVYDYRGDAWMRRVVRPKN